MKEPDLEPIVQGIVILKNFVSCNALNVKNDNQNNPIPYCWPLRDRLNPKAESF